MCRNPASAPNEGVFVDKDGLACTKFDAAKDRYGCSMLLGGEGLQGVPGHPHFWKEDDGREFMGYDFRASKDGERWTGLDYFGIRRVEWVDGWPTIWKRVTVTFKADDAPWLVGEPLMITLSSEDAGRVAFDHVSLTVDDAPTAATTTTVDDAPTAATTTTKAKTDKSCKDNKKWKLEREGKKKLTCKKLAKMTAKKQKKQCKTKTEGNAGKKMLTTKKACKASCKKKCK